MKNRNDIIARTYDVMMAAATVPGLFMLSGIHAFIAQPFSSLYAAGATLGATVVGVAAYVVPATLAAVGIYQAVKLDHQVRCGKTDPLGIGRKLERRGVLAPSRNLKPTQRSVERSESPERARAAVKTEDLYATTGQVSRRHSVPLASRTYPDLHATSTSYAMTQNPLQRGEEQEAR